MEPRGEKPKPFLLDPKPTLPFSNSAFAQNHNLPPATQRLNHHRPFFKSNLHREQFIYPRKKVESGKLAFGTNSHYTIP